MRYSPTVGADVHGLTGERLRGARKRYTRRRQELVDLLLAAGGPLTVENILILGPQLRLSSVYRNLTVLEDADVVRRLSRDQGGHARFELSEGLTGHHHHLACNSCGAMTDVELTDSIEQDLERELDRLALERGFEISSHRLDIFGRCQSCPNVEASLSTEITSAC
jgi:Fur family transcriptional regulator, ferric uptake regulator